MDESENRIWLDHGTVRGVIYETGFTPLELVLGETILARPVPRPNAEGEGDALVIEEPLPATALSSGMSVLVLRREAGALPLATLPVFIGTALTDTLPGEVAMLRAELDLIKSVLRQRLRGR